MKSAVTVSLVPEAKGGPFVYWDGLEHAFANAQRWGFDAVEIFAPGPDAVDRQQLQKLVDRFGLPVAAVGTGAGMVLQGLNLVDSDDDRRAEAIRFIRDMIDFGAEFSAPAVIGSMQGKWGGDLDQVTALARLKDALEQLGDHAAGRNVNLLYEPLNRYESNLINTMSETCEFCNGLSADNVKVLADLFHMNIEEANIADGIRTISPWLGHVHFVDSNRRAAGWGHTDFSSIATALNEVGYDGYLSVEAFPLPDSDACARQTIKAYRDWFGRQD